MLKEYFGRNKRHQLLSVVLVVSIVAPLGIYLLVNSRAATPYASVAASQGTLSGANLQTDSTASNGQRVVFGQSMPMDGNVALALLISGTPFAPSSFWNTPLPASTPVNVNSGAYINAIRNNLCKNAATPPAISFVATTPPASCTSSTYYGYLNSTAYSAPLYVVPADQPTVTVEASCSPTNTAFAAGRANVPVPADAHGAAGTDQEIEIYQPSTDKYWDFWHFQKDTATGNWEACWGGVINTVSQSNGIFPSNTGATATSLPLIGADPRIDEFLAGHIDHAIGLTIGDVNSADLSKTVIPANTPGATNGISWPATRTDGGSTDPLAVPEGQRFRLPANLDLNQYALTPVAMTIAVAAQKYGFVVNDSCGQPCITIRIGDPTAYTVAGLPDPYKTGPGVGGVGSSGLFGGVAQTLIMKNFPWDQLQALPFNYGKPGNP